MAKKFWEIMLDAGTGLQSLSEIGEILRVPREQAIEGITQFMAHSSVKQQYQMEQHMINAMRICPNPDQRVRLMELYAWLKVRETYAQNDQFQGFITDGGPMDA